MFISQLRSITIIVIIIIIIHFLMIMIIIFNSFPYTHFELWGHGIDLCSRSSNDFEFQGVTGLGDWCRNGDCKRSKNVLGKVWVLECSHFGALYAFFNCVTTLVFEF